MMPQSDEELSDDQFYGILQLGINCSNHYVAEKTARIICGLVQLQAFTVDANMARWLLVAAATRRHHTALSRMIASPALVQHITAPTFLSMLEQLVAADTYRDVCAQLLQAVWSTTAQQLSSEAVLHLLRVAMEDRDTLRRATDNLKKLCALPRGQRISSDALVQLVRWTIQQGKPLCIDPLLSLPAARQVSSDVVTELLWEALEQAPEAAQHISSICQLPAAQQLSRNTIRLLMHAAEEQSNLSCQIQLMKAQLDVARRKRMLLRSAGLHLEGLSLIE
jgi:hypothetical protein